MRAQVHELCTQYGEIHGFWWDAIRWREDVDEDPGLNELIRELQPKAIINDRGYDQGDFSTMERDYRPDEVNLKPINVPPLKATLLNNGRKIDFSVRFKPSDHRDPKQKAYLSLINLPVDKLCNTVPVIKLEFNTSLDNLILPSSPQDGITRHS